MNPLLNDSFNSADINGRKEIRDFFRGEKKLSGGNPKKLEQCERK